MGWVRWRQVVEALPRQSFKQLKAGAGWGLPGEFRAALGGDLLDGGEAVSTLVVGEQSFQQVGVRIGAHDRIVIRSAELHAERSAGRSDEDPERRGLRSHRSDGDSRKTRPRSCPVNVGGLTATPSLRESVRSARSGLRLEVREIDGSGAGRNGSSGHVP